MLRAPSRWHDIKHQKSPSYNKKRIKMRAIWCHHMKVQVLQTLHLISKYIFFFSMSHVVSNFCQRLQILNFFSKKPWNSIEKVPRVPWSHCSEWSEARCCCLKILQGDVDGLQYECKSVLQLYEHYQYSSNWRNILDRSFLHIKSADQQMMATY